VPPSPWVELRGPWKGGAIKKEEVGEGGKVIWATSRLESKKPDGHRKNGTRAGRADEA